jgi:hypothetical protein
VTTQPPKLAKWLLNHFGCSRNNDAVIGDLDERFQQGHSPAWYGKQVLVTIVVSIVSIFDIRTVKFLDVRAVIAGWVVFTACFHSLFPVFGRCTVLTAIAGLVSGLTVTAHSRQLQWLSLLFYTATMSVYWISLGLISNPYAPSVQLYKWIGFRLTRNAHVSVETLVGNLVVLILFAWLGGSVCLGSDAKTESLEHES